MKKLTLLLTLELTLFLGVIAAAQSQTDILGYGKKWQLADLVVGGILEASHVTAASYAFTGTGTVMEINPSAADDGKVMTYDHVSNRLLLQGDQTSYSNILGNPSDDIVAGNQLNWGTVDTLDVVEGSGSGLDADLLDGNDSSYFWQKQSGTTNYLAKWTGTNTLGDSIIYDNGNVGIGESNPLSTLHIKEGDSGLISTESGNALLVESDQNALITMSTGSSGTQSVIYYASGTVGSSYEAFNLYDYNNERFEWWNENGSLLYLGMGDGQDAYFYGGTRLQNTTHTTAGMVRFTGSDFEGYTGSDWLSFTEGALSAGGAVDSMTETVTSGLVAFFHDDNTIRGDTGFYYDLNNNYLGINNGSPNETLDVNGTIEYSSSSGVRENDVTYITHPGGASLSVGSGAVGAIKIRLPVSWTNTMMRMTVQIYKQGEDESITVYCGGYTSPGGDWTRTFAQIISGRTNQNHAVRFGHDGTYCCIWIGETSTEWHYGKIVITEFIGSNSGDAFNTWDDGWSITLDTDFSDDTITDTENYNMVSPWLTDSDSDIYYAYDGNVGIGDNTPDYKLDVYESKTNSSYSYAAYIENDSVYTTNGTYNSTISLIRGRPNIGAGVTNSGYDIGEYISILVDDADAGTFDTIKGLNVQYGMYSGGSTITDAYGISIQPYHKSGTVENSYVLYLQNATTGGTVTNYYAIYQEDSTADNYFAGDTGFGTTSPGTKLDVNGSIRTNNQYISTVATGTKPFDVASTTLNTNLNADLLDGYHASAFLQQNEVITLSGDVTGSGRTSITTSLTTNSVSDNEIDYNNVTLNDFENDAHYIQYINEGGGITSTYIGSGQYTIGVDHDGTLGIDGSNNLYVIDNYVDISGDTMSSGADIDMNTGDLTNINKLNLEIHTSIPSDMQNGDIILYVP